jgi:hypothetical protein
MLEAFGLKEWLLQSSKPAMKRFHRVGIKLYIIDQENGIYDVYSPFNEGEGVLFNSGWWKFK